MGVHWKDWGWSWNCNTLATWCEELTHLKRPWCWESLRAGGKGDLRGWDGWMASLTQWTWVWVDSRSWWWTGWPGVLWSMRLQRVRHDWATKLNWTEHYRLICLKALVLYFFLYSYSYLVISQHSSILTLAWLCDGSKHYLNRDLKCTYLIGFAFVFALNYQDKNFHLVKW